MRRIFITRPCLFAYWKKAFGDSGITHEEANVSLQQILKKVTGGYRLMKHTGIFPIALLSKSQVTDFNESCRKRVTRMPLQYILEEWDFHCVTLKMRPPVFIPRPETEQLVDIVLSYIKQLSTKSGKPDINLFEVGCGSGAISLALATTCPKVKCVAVDKSIYAVRLARENVVRLGLESRVKICHAEVLSDGSLFAMEGHCNVDEQQVDIIVSNPPYIRIDEQETLDPEVCRFEDPAALFGGIDGLDAIRSILKFSLSHLKSKGQIFLEVGLSHPHIIRDILKTIEYQELKLVKIHPDFTERDRFIELSLERAFQK